MPAYTFRDFLLDEMKQRQMKSASEFARFLGVTASTVTRSLDARNPRDPGLEFLMRISRATGRSLLSLIEIAYPEEVAGSRISASAQLLAQQIDALPERDRDVIRRVIRGGLE